MSSQTVRNAITNFIQTELPGENLIDLTIEFQEIRDMIEDAGLTSLDPWLGLQFVGGEEVPVDIAASNTVGKYREEGIIYLHIVEIAKLGPKNAIITRADFIRSKFRGQRIGDLVVRRVSPPQTGLGVTLNFEGGYTAALVQVDYSMDFDL